MIGMVGQNGVSAVMRLERGYFECRYEIWLMRAFSQIKVLLDISCTYHSIIKSQRVASLNSASAAP